MHECKLPLAFRALKAGVLDMWSKRFAPQEEAENWWFPSDHVVLCQECGSVVRMCLSLSYQF